MKKTMKLMVKVAGSLILAVLLPACAYTTQQATEPAGPGPLRVGVSAIYPPMLYKSGGTFAGIEADFAEQLGKALNRPVELVELPWEGQIPALLEGKTDIIMSGMSITEARRVRIQFSDPYLRAGLGALLRTSDYLQLRKAGNRIPRTHPVGVKKGTLAETYVQQEFPSKFIVPIFKSEHAVTELNRRTIDGFIGDLPEVIWLASENEGELTAVALASTESDFAWGARRSDTALVTSVNRILAEWRKDGTWDRIIHKWLGDKVTIEEVQP
jgi:polar amino acid transport system substrate-binding protein